MKLLSVCSYDVDTVFRLTITCLSLDWYGHCYRYTTAAASFRLSPLHLFLSYHLSSEFMDVSGSRVRLMSLTLTMFNVVGLPLLTMLLWCVVW